MRRSSVSIVSNIAEGSKRSRKDFAHFVTISQGSGAELETQLYLTRRLNYIDEATFQKHLEALHSIMRMLTKLYKSLLTKPITNN